MIAWGSDRVTLCLPTDSGGRRWNFLAGRLAASATNGFKKGALLSQRMAEKFVVRLHALACDRAEEVAFGRWLRNEAVTVEELHEHCGKEIADRVAGRHVLAIQDTTELNYQRHARRTRGLGTVGNGTDAGLFLHPTLAIDAENGHCLGLVGAQVYVRHEGAEVDRRKRTIEEKESFRWLQGVETADEVLRDATHVTHVQDREGDIYEQFVRPRAAHSDLLIRTCQDRKLTDGKMLFATMSAMPVVRRFRLTLRAQPGKRKARTAKLELRFGEVTIARPVNMSPRVAPPQVTLRVVDVCEYDVPPGEKPIHWRLSTTHEVKDIAAAMQIVEWYRLRWNIEQLFWVMKSQGFDIESSQLETAEALMKLAIITALTACRVMRLVRARDGQVPQAARDLFEPGQIELLAVLQLQLEGRTARQKNPHLPETLAWAAWIIARLGGWKGYSKSEGPPAT
jgi:Transposase DDE domain